MDTKRHGNWIDPHGGGQHSGRYCNVNGAHITRRCGIQHRDFAENEQCPVLRVYCPELGGIIEREDAYRYDFA